TAFIGWSTVILYLFAYTPLKKKSVLSTLVGAVPGALPPLIGWTAAGGGLNVQALALFSILFFWQLPHFMAIAFM
ncbi:MAG: UbiA family prenyltransferase, partial [Candidatus Omnitrophica bacterium]|nr:UbiA family prenyltransferase [Candidatus Omnitrophota bacterium]